MRGSCSIDSPAYVDLAAFTFLLASYCCGDGVFSLMIWDTFAVDKVVDVSAHVLLCLSPHVSLYPSHLPYMFLRQMWYLLWKHKMLKMSTREQCQVSNQARGSRHSVPDWKLDSKC
ncbi:hypothetical protein ACFX1T_013334 [Malus domestica]